MINEHKGYNHAAGWRVFSMTVDGVEHFRELKELKPNRIVSLISPSGEVFENIRNVCAFCKEHNLHNSHVTDMINGKQKSSQGWTIHSITFEEAS